MLSSSVEIFDPYHSEIINFRDEKKAYDYFTSEVGLDKYTQALVEHINECCDPLYLIGFSVGAAAIWNVSTHEVGRKVLMATCFYGSQIRNYKHVKPRFQIDLVFPVSEHHFSVNELIAELSGTDKVSSRQVSFLHGFMNKHSENFDQTGYEQEILLLRENVISQTL